MVVKDLMDLVDFLGLKIFSVVSLVVAQVVQKVDHNVEEILNKMLHFLLKKHAMV